MTRMFTYLAGACGLLCAAGVSAAPAISVTSPTGPNLGNPPFTLGWSFNVNVPIRVTALGFYDSSQDGLEESHELGLWDAGGTLLASAVIGAGTSGTLVDFFRYVGIPSVTLAPGTYQVGALFLTGLDPVLFPGYAGTVTADPRISFGGATFQFGGTLANPNVPFGGEGFFGPNLNIEAVPEPGTWALLIAGFGLVGAAARRRGSRVAVA